VKVSQTLLLVDDFSGCFRLGEGVVAGPVSRPVWGGRVVYLRDPGRNLVELFQLIPMEEE
jgi:hypothetical protein